MTVYLDGQLAAGAGLLGFGALLLVGVLTYLLSGGGRR